MVNPTCHFLCNAVVASTDVAVGADWRGDDDAGDAVVSVPFGADLLGLLDALVAVEEEAGWAGDWGCSDAVGVLEEVAEGASDGGASDALGTVEIEPGFTLSLESDDAVVAVPDSAVRT